MTSVCYFIFYFLYDICGNISTKVGTITCYDLIFNWWLWKAWYILKEPKLLTIEESYEEPRIQRIKEN